MGSPAQPPTHRAEIEQILRTHRRSHFAQNFVLMERGLRVDDIAREMCVSRDRAADVSKAVRMTLTGEPVTMKKWASLQAAIYRELLNCQMSPELHQHVKTRLAELQQIDSTIKSEPLGHINLGANDRQKPEKPRDPCPSCFQIHSGECL
jgi:hypothetical protein